MLKALKRYKGDLLAIAFVSLVSLLLANLNLYSDIGFRSNAERERGKAKVLSVDNTMVARHGMLLTGVQYLQVEILSGRFKGEKSSAINLLRSQMELDKLFEPGDTATVSIGSGGTPGNLEVMAQDHYRLHYELGLFLLFAVCLLIFGGLTGLKALLTFIFTCLLVWKVLIPMFLKGYDPIWLSLIAVCVLCAVIIFLIAGVRAKGWTAFCGASSVSCAAA